MVKKVGSVKETGRQDKGNCFQQEKRMFVLYMMVTDGNSKWSWSPPWLKLELHDQGHNYTFFLEQC
jgi:hypothetical protein